MEKVYIKPQAQEIIIKGASADGHLDIFSYDPSDDQTQKLGNLFVLGHIQHETDDMAYAINLISALAKREYYAKLSATPREAFASTLKKINEVVEEFFEHKGVSINIGIFAIAGEQMLISKLGKFKVLLARDDKTIDVLNNIMFDKETVQEKQFSSVISGQVNEHDRILAYYPSRAVSARERYLKMYLHKYDGAQFADQLKTIKKEKDGFGCAMVYIRLDKVKETTHAPHFEPQELAPAKLASTTPLSGPRKAHAEKKSVIATAVREEAPAVRPAPVKMADMPAVEEPEPEVTVKEIVSTPKRYVETNQEIPHIISTEFSLGRKNNALTSAFRRIRLNQLTPYKKAIMTLVAVMAIIGVSFGLRSLINLNPAARETNAAVKTAQEQLDLAKIKVTQNDTTGARGILNASLLTLMASPNPKTDSVKAEILQMLDDIDQAKDVSPNLVAQLPADQGTVSYLTIGKEVLAYAAGTAPDVGKLIGLKNGSVDFTRDAKNTRASALVLSSKGTPVVIDLANLKTVALKDAGPEIATFSLPQPFGGTAYYEDNLYVLHESGIYKVADMFQGDVVAKTWLKSGSNTPGDAVLTAVDGNVYVLTKGGTLLTYFRGEKKSEVATSLNVSSDDLFITNADGPSLYLLNKQAGRIYVLDKKTGTLLKTWKVGNQNPIVTAALGSDNTFYFATQDNKIWKIPTE